MDYIELEDLKRMSEELWNSQSEVDSYYDVLLIVDRLIEFLEERLVYVEEDETQQYE